MYRWIIYFAAAIVLIIIGTVLAQDVIVDLTEGMIDEESFPIQAISEASVDDGLHFPEESSERQVTTQVDSLQKSAS